jgi:hypothetical protein
MLVFVFPGTQLGLIDTATSQLTPLATGYSSFGRLAVTGPGLSDPQGGLTLVTVAGSASKAQAVVMLQVGGWVGLSGIVQAGGHLAGFDLIIPKGG